MKDFNSSVLYMFQEYVYPAMAKGIKNNNLQVLTQTSSQPGTNVGASGTPPPVPVHSVNLEYREIPTSEFISAGTDVSRASVSNAVTQNFPNPAKGSTSFMITVSYPAHVKVEISNIMGQPVTTNNLGMMQPGTHQVSIDCASLTHGIYFYTVNINGELFTRKMIVE